MKRLLLAIFILSSFYSVAQNANYTELSGPYGGELQDLVSGTGVIVGINQLQGIVRSTDNGVTWVTSNTGITDTYLYDLEVDQVSGKIYALANSKLFASTDNAATWVTVASTGFGSGYKIKKAPNGYLYIIQTYTNPKSVYRSINNGTTWSLASSFSAASAVTDFEVTPIGDLYVSTSGDGIFQSTNKGLNFTQINTGISAGDLNVSSLTVNGSDVYALGSSTPYKSTDRGATWTSIKNNLTDNCFYSSLIESAGGKVFIFNSNGCAYNSAKVYSSADNGASWTPLAAPNSAFGGTYLGNFRGAVMVSSTVAFASLDGTVMKSIDGCVTWSEASKGITSLSAADLFMTDNGRLLYAQNNNSNGFYYSIDDGSTWDYMYQTPRNKKIYGFLKGSSSGQVYAYGNGLIKSTDNGTNWTEINPGIYLPALVTNDYTTFYSTSGYNLQKSIDAGVTWTSQAMTGFPGSSYMVNKKMFLDASGNFYFLIYNYTTNPGKTELYKVASGTTAAVQITNLPTTLYDADFNSGKLYVVSTTGSLLISSDGGANWTTKSTTTTYGTVKVIDNNTMYMLNDNAYLSTDGGNSWVNTGDFGNGRWAQDVLISSTSSFSYIAVDNGVVVESVKPVVPPAAPTGLQVTAFSQSRIGLTWTDNSTNEDYFIIERSIGNNSAYDSIATLAANAFTTAEEYVAMASLNSQATYYFRIRAASAAGKSAYTNEVSATTLVNCLATSAIPTNRSWTATSGTFTDLLVTITDGGTSGLYVIDKLTAGAASPNSQASFVENCGNVFLNTGSYRSNGNGTWNPTTKTLTIPWKRRPVNTATLASGTTVFTLNTVDPAPTTPNNPAVYVTSDGGVTLSWTGSTYAEEYIIERSTTSASSGFSELARVDYKTNSKVDAGLTTGATYYYRLRAHNTKGAAGADQYSAYSSVVQITVQVPFFSAIQIAPFDASYNNSYSAGWADLDGDGFDDLAIPYIGTDVALKTYRNKGDGTFEEAIFPNLATERGTWYGAATADYDNDGKVDIFATTNTTGKNKLWTNKGTVAGFDKMDLATPTLPNYSPSFADFNKDGLLDLVNFELGGSTPKPLKIYVQQPDHTFLPYDIGEIATDLQFSWSHSWVDYDNDNDLDLLIDAYNGGLAGAPNNRLYQNQGSDANGFIGFTKVAGTAFETDFDMWGESSSWADFDNDGDLDVFKGNTGPSATLNDMLYKNNGDGTFTRLPASLPAEIWWNATTGGYTNSSAWGDVDNDGDQDLLVVRDPQSALYLNAGNGTFTKYSNIEFLTATDNARSNSSGAFADYNKDGHLDMFLDVNGSNLGVFVLKNTSTSGKWIEFKLQGTVSNRSAIGARITLNLPSGKKQMREITTTSGWGAQSSLAVHFGLGSTTVIPSVVIRWPSGITQTLTNVNANQILNITEDGVGPIVTSVSPADASISVATSSTLSITFNEPPVAVATKKITITPILPAGTAFTIDATAGVISGNVVTFTPSTALNIYTKYSVTIDAGAFTDVYNNPMSTYTIAWTFTSLDNIAPVISATEFTALVAKGFGSTKFTATATDNGSLASVIMSYRGIGSASSFANLTGTLNGTTGKWEFNALETYYNTTGLEFYFTARDAENNATLEPTTGVKQSLFETTPPVLTVPSIPPLISKGFVTRVFSVSATDNFAVSSVVMSYRNTKTGVVYTDLAGALNGTVAGQYDFSVPETAFTNDGLEFYFTASDATGNTIRNPLATDSPAAFKTLLDNQAPTFATFSPPASLAKASVPLTAKASDNLAVTSVVMKYRGIASKTFITSLPGVKNGNGDYEFTVGADWFDNMGIEYYFRAVDASKNIGVSPDTTAITNTYYRTYIKYEGAALPKLTLIKGSIEASGYQIVSVPLNLSNQNIADNFEELGTADKTAFRFLRYHASPSPGWDEYPGGGLSVLARGEGYFLNSLNAEQITLLDGVAPPIDQSNLFAMVLKKGWNQIGNPYTVQIQWSDVIAYNNTPAGVGKLVKYDNGYNTNDANGIIEPYKGGFVEAASDITLKIPFKGFTTGGRVEKVESDFGQQNWEMPFTLTQQDLTYQVGLIGMNKEASLTKDRFDLSAVPRLGKYIEATFDHPEYFTKRFSQDVVPTQLEYTWEFDVASNLEGEALMSWNNTLFGENSKEIYLMDVISQKLVNMRERNSYRFDPKQSSHFKIFFGENLETKIKPSHVALSKIYPNPTSGITTIAFALPEQKTEMNVKLEVFDVRGKKISTLVNGNLAPGFYSTEWDATTPGVVEGLYVCRLLVNGDRGQEVLSEKIIVKK